MCITATTPTPTTSNTATTITTTTTESLVIQRSTKASKTWCTVAMQPTQDEHMETFHLQDVSTIYDQVRFEQFCTLRGSYFINGLGSCQIGDRIMHPFEVHGLVKSLVFYGNGEVTFRKKIIQTPLTEKERSLNCPVARGVMSTLSDISWPHSFWNMIAPSHRDTANLVAHLWPPPEYKSPSSHTSSSSQSLSSTNTALTDQTNQVPCTDTINKRVNSVTYDEPILIVCSDHGSPYALDPQTLQTKGKLVDVLAKKLKPHLGDSKLLAHMHRSRHRPIGCRHQDDEHDAVKVVDSIKQQELVEDVLVLCTQSFTFPGDTNQGNSTMTFFEFDIHWNLVRSRSYTTRFMVFHDFCVTEEYYVVPQNPAVLEWTAMAKFALGQGVGTGIFRMDQSCPGEFCLIPRFDTSAPVKRVADQDFFNIFHFGPTFQERKKQKEKHNDSVDDTERSSLSSLIVHGISFDQYKFGNEGGFNGQSQTFDPIAWGSGEAPPPRLDRFEICLNTNTIRRKHRIPIRVSNKDDKTDQENDIDIPVDMPVFRHDGKKCRYSYFVGASRPEGWFPFRSIVKLDFETGQVWNWDAGDGQITSEPMFLPRERVDNKEAEVEDDGFVISIIHDAENMTCRLVIWDSLTFDDGPIAAVPLGELMPWCVHGSWYPNYIP